MPFTNKVTLGTYISDGVRTGPVLPAEMYNSTYTTQGPNAVNPTGNIKARNYGEFGNSILLSSQNTYRITPFNGALAGVPNIFALQTGPVSAGIIPLFAGTANNNPAALLVQSTTTNTPYIQFDYPRVPGVILTYTGVTSPSPSLDSVRIVFRGTDGYGFPIAHQYTLTDAGLPNSGVMYPLTYSSPVNQIEDGTGSWACAVKAFDTITEVELLDNLPATYTLLGIATNMFGLPYKCSSPADIINMSWAGQNLKDLNGTIELSQSAEDVWYVAAIINPGVGQFYATVDPYTYTNFTGVSLTNYYVSPASAMEDARPSDLMFSVGESSVTDDPNEYFNAGVYDEILTANYIPFAALPVVGYNTADSISTAPVLDINWTLTNGGYNLVQYADESEPSLTSGDPRGVIRLPGTQDFYSTWSSTLYPYPDGFQNTLEFTQYISGADNFQNQLSASGYIIGTESDPTTAETTVIPLLTLQDLYGKTPFSGE